MTAHRHFLKYFFGFLAVFFLACGAVSFVVDPYGIWDNHGLVGINRIKNKISNRERLFKAVAVMQKKPDIILMGSSRTLLGLNPEHPALQARGHVYNLGLSAASMKEIKKYFEHALANQPDLKEVVLGLDFFMFNELRKQAGDYDENLIGRRRLPFQNGFASLFSISALKDSVLTALYNYRFPAGAQDYKPNGMMDIAVIDKRGLEKLGSRQKTFEDALKSDFFGGSLYSRYRFSEDAFADLKHLISLCRDKGIRLTLFVSPSHAAEWEGLRMANAWSDFENWKRSVVKLHPLWDFSGYNSVTTEPIGDAMLNYIDSSHYTVRVGNWILERTLGLADATVPDGFGVLLTPETVESHFVKSEEARQSWTQINSETLDWLKKLKTARRDFEPNSPTVRRKMAELSHD